MQYFQGKSVYKGIVMGPVAVLKKNDYQVKRKKNLITQNSLSKIQKQK